MKTLDLWLKAQKAWPKVRKAWPLAWIAQAGLIVLPVVILSGVALHFLHEDRTAIEQDAKNRANAIAPEVARQIGEQITAFLIDSRKKGLLTEGKIADGQGFAVPDYQRLPTPADWVAKLPSRDAQLWQTAQAARFQHPNADAAKTALTSLAESGNPTTVRANAQLGLLVGSESREAAHGDPAALIRQAIAIAQQFPGEVTESGVPVADLALLLALRHVGKGDLPRDLVTAIENNLAWYPSFLSTDILDAVAAAAATDPAKSTVARLRGEWLQQEARRENTRNMMRALADRFTLVRTPFYPRSHLPLPTPLFYSDGESRATEIQRRRMLASNARYVAPRQGMALCAPHSWGWQVTLVRLSALRPALHVNLPDYLGASLNLPGDRWYLGDLRGVRVVPPLAQANVSFSLDTKFRLDLLLDLRNPGLLYSSYQRRLYLTQGLIFSAVAAALLGLWRLWQTYRDQARLNEMKSNLVSSVSHELRAPIAAVRLMAESLETGRVDGADKQNDYYRLIVRECRRLSSLVENVLDFSRIDQGRKQYHFEPLDALALLRHTVMLMEPGAAERQVRLRLIDPPAEFENLQPAWDSEAIEQSMVNLLDNAIKHSPAGAEVRVEVELLPAFVRFWVVDAGPGIPAEEQQKIFDLFYRYGSELRRETEGVGIGLSIVKHVAEAHGGRVLVESRVGSGSRFGLELPK